MVYYGDGMKVGILTMFGGLATIYSLVNVVAEHIRMLLEAGIEVKLLVCEDLPDSEKHGIYLDPRIEWAKVCNRYLGKQIHWRDYSSPDTAVHPELLEEAAAVGEDLAKNYKGTKYFIENQVVSAERFITANGTSAIEFAKEILNYFGVMQKEDLDDWYHLFKVGFYQK
jgi:hypothetical protein